MYILAFGTYVNWYVIDVIGDELLTIPAAFLLPYLGYLCGFIIAVIFRRNRKVAITIAIETGVQNASIPILVLQRSFPQPDGDLAAVMPLAAAYLYSIPIVIAWICLLVYRKYTGQDVLATEENESAHGTKGQNVTKENAVSNGAVGTEEKQLGTNPGFLDDSVTTEF